MMTDATSEILELLNLGPVSTEWLRAVGIRTVGDLEALGSLEAFRLVRSHGFRPSLNLLYALEAALSGIHWTTLPHERRAQLRVAAKTLKP
jgi:DNA transformation protein